MTSRAPIQRNRWSHVGGMYDGRFVRLFIDGEQVGQVAASGTVRDRDQPTRIGNNRAGDTHVRGAIDNVFVSMSPDVSPQTFADLSCIREPFEVEINPLASPKVQPDTPFNYTISITNRNAGACGSQFVFINAFSSEEGISATISPTFTFLDSGQTVDAVLTVIGTTDAEPGTHEIPFFVSGDDFQQHSVEFTLAEPTGCFVRTSRELMIRDLSVVEDPVRTTFNDPGAPNSGVWTFANLMRQMAPSPSAAPAMVEQVFESWLVDQTVNTFTMPARTAMQSLVLDSWPRTANGELDLERAPLRLLAIVNRVDIRDLSKGQAGEGRFVFGVLGLEERFPLEFTMILEYALPATTARDHRD